jgi:transposase
VLSQFCRVCKGNYAVFFGEIWPILREKEQGIERRWYLFVLTFGRAVGILELTIVLIQETHMSDEKLTILRQSHTLHPHPEEVRDTLFTSGSPFFDPRDLVQVKYELLRRVRVDGYAVSDATALFALSRPTFYAAQAAWEQAGTSGLLPAPTGPRHAHKLTDEIITDLQPLAKTMSSAQLAVWLQEQRSLVVHPRSIERALKRVAKKGGSSS